MYDRYLDRVLETYATGRFEAQVRSARREYFAKLGDVFEDDPLYDVRMSCFLEWYLFERKLDGDDHTPVDRFLVEHAPSLDPGERRVFHGITDSVRSLFEVRARKENEVVLFDFLYNCRRRVVDRSAIRKGDMFEARIIPLDDRWYFTRGFCHHPPEARKYIAAETKRVRQLGPEGAQELLQRLVYLAYLKDRFSHIDPRRIYSDDGLRLLGGPR